MFSQQGRQPIQAGICWSHCAAAQKFVKTEPESVKYTRAVTLKSILAGKQWWLSTFPHLDSDQLQFPLTQMITGRSWGWGSVGGMTEYTEGHPEGSGCHVGHRAHHSWVTDCARGRGDFDSTCPGDVDNNRWIMNRIRNTHSPPSKNGNMFAKRAELHKRPLCPLNEDEQKSKSWVFELPEHAAWCCSRAHTHVTWKMMPAELNLKKKKHNFPAVTFNHHTGPNW